MCSPDDSGPVVEAGVDHDLVALGEAVDALAEPDDDAGAVRAEDPRLRRGGKPAAQPDVEMVERGRPETDRDLAGPGLRVGRVLVAQDLRPAVLVDADRLHGAIVSVRECYLAGEMTSDELARWRRSSESTSSAQRPAQPYAETERRIRERRARGLFADMRFTMAQPEVSCHPETLLPGARTVVSAALCYYAPGPEPEPGEGRLPRYTWGDALRAAPREARGARRAARRRATACSSTRTSTSTARAPRAAGVGFYGKNTMLITRTHGSWVVLGTLVTDVEIEPTPPLELDCGSCTLCIDACPTGALDEPGRRSTRPAASRTGRRRPRAIPEPYREELGAQVYGCDICQDVCPWNRGVEKRRAGPSRAEGAEPVVSLLDWLEPPDEELRERYDRLYVPRNDPRYLRRNALVAAGNSADRGLVEAVRPYAEGDDQLLREHAGWALARLEDDR